MSKKKFFIYPLLAVASLALGACSDDDGGNGEEGGPAKGRSPYVTKVLEYRPAPGQFVNEMPEYAEGDTQEDMNATALAAIGNDARGGITLGG